MGERDFHPMSANFLLPKWAKTHWGNYVEGKGNVGKTADPSDWRLARTIFVADDDKTAAAYGRNDPASPYRFYYEQLLNKLKKGGRHVVFKESMDQPDEELTMDFILDRLVIHGSVGRAIPMRSFQRLATSASWSTRLWTGSTKDLPNGRCS